MKIKQFRSNKSLKNYLNKRKHSHRELYRLKNKGVRNENQ